MKAVHCVDVNRDHSYEVVASTLDGIARSLACCGWTLANGAEFGPGEEAIVRGLDGRTLDMPEGYRDAQRRPWYLVTPAETGKIGKTIFDVPGAFAATPYWKVTGPDGLPYSGRFSEVDWPPDGDEQGEPLVTIVCQQGRLSLSVTGPLSCCERLDAGPDGGYARPAGVLTLAALLARIGPRYLCTPLESAPWTTRIETPRLLPDGDVLDLYAESKAGGRLLISDGGEALGFLSMQTADEALPQVVEDWIAFICRTGRVDRRRGALVVEAQAEGDVVEALLRLEQAVLATADLYYLLVAPPASGAADSK
jgi:hypothetical protein